MRIIEKNDGGSELHADPVERRLLWNVLRHNETALTKDDHREINALRQVLELPTFPDPCAACGEYAGEGAHVCPSCREKGACK